MRQFLAITVVLLISTLAPAMRLVDSWPYSKLFEKADLIVIAKVDSVEAAKGDPLSHSWSTELNPFNCKMTVQHVLKGTTDVKSLTVLHYRWGKPKKDRNGNDLINFILEDGPMLVEFRTEGLFANIGDQKNVILSTPQYMLFLKKLTDGRYEPISGHIDPAFSVFELNNASDKLSDGMDNRNKPKVK